MRIFLMGASPAITETDFSASQARLQATGGNSGNQVIAYGMLSTFRHSEVSWDYSVGPERVTEEYDAIVVAAANFLHSGFDLGGIADFIEKTKLPVVIAGLGAQSNTDNYRDLILMEGTERFVKVIADRANTIGVRGAFTAEVLWHRGIKNIEIVGCPSYYMGGIDVAVANKSLETDFSNTAMHCSRDVIHHSFSSEIMRKAVIRLYEMAYNINASFICQTELQEIILAECSDQELRAKTISDLKNIFVDRANDPEFWSWLSLNSRVFWSVPDWLCYLSKKDFVCGTRIHGTIMGLHSGTPSLCIYHDTRTKELCRFLGVPSIGIAELDNFGISDLREMVDLENYAWRRRELIFSYRSFLERNGLKASI